jgi:3-dehydroquinate synthase
MMFAAHLSHLSGRLPSEVLERHRSILTSVGLPVTYQNDDWETLLDAMKIDKKSRGATLRFVVLDDVARPAILEGPDSALLIAAFNEVVQAN